MSQLVLGIDQGTSSTRCLAVDAALQVRGVATVPVGATFPGPGLVEQDPLAIADSVDAAVAGAISAADASIGDVAAVGVANQTETFVVVGRASGVPIHPAIVWQDRRTASRCATLVAAGHGEMVRRRTGLELDATFPATKISWLLDEVAGARAAAEAGELVYLDMGGWIVRHLTEAILAETGNAGRTLLCELGGTAWDDDLLDLFGVPRAMLPPIVDSDAIAAARPHGSGARGEGEGLTVAAVLGDQQASLFGLGGWEPGLAKVTLGTGAFVLVQAGPEPPSPPDGVLTSCAWRRAGANRYALEGFVPTAGAALSWFAELGLLPPLAELEALLADSVTDDGGVVCVPALQGLGTPSWDAATRGTLLGLSRATTRAQAARAVVDGVLHQVADALEVIGGAMPVASVLLDGGMSRSDWIVQRLADVAGIEVRRAARAEATAVGAAMMAGLSAGVWASDQELPPVIADWEARPRWSDADRAARRERWAEAVALARRWTS